MVLLRTVSWFDPRGIYETSPTLPIVLPCTLHGVGNVAVHSRWLALTFLPMDASGISKHVNILSPPQVPLRLTLSVKAQNKYSLKHTLEGLER